MGHFVTSRIGVEGEFHLRTPTSTAAEQLVTVLRERGATPGYLILPDEGHDTLGIISRAVFVREVVHWLISHLLDVDERSA